jgi:polar amino acid transport system permease protein
VSIHREPEGQDSALSDVPVGEASGARIRAALGFLKEVPTAIVMLVLIGSTIGFLALTSEHYRTTFRSLSSGVLMTIRISLLSYGLALVVGLIAGFGCMSKNIIFRSISILYVEIGRGLPLLVQILYIAFVVAPAVSGWLGTGKIDETARVIVALAFCSGAYLAEVYRAGIESISRGQMQAARSLGMTRFQSMRYVILPQAIRVVLPALANNFVGNLKDTSLASVVGVLELTQLGRLNIARTMDTFTSWNSVSLIYLMMTITLSLGVRKLEKEKAT